MLRSPGLRGALAGGLAVAMVLSTAGAARADDPWWGRDKALHFGVSAVLTIGGWGVSVPLFDEEWPRLVVGGSVALAAGIGKELYDLSGRGDPSWKDFTWDLIGIATGLLVSFGLDRWLVDEGGGAEPETMP